MKYLTLLLVLLSYTLGLYSKTVSVFEVEMEANETAILLYEFNEAKKQIDIVKMDSLWNKLSEPQRIFSKEQQALKSACYGWFYYYNDLYDEALKHFNEAYKLAEIAKQRQLLLYVKASIGNVEYTNKNIKEAIAIFRDVLDETLAQDWKLVAKLYGNIAPLQNELAIVPENKHYLDSAEENYKKSISILEEHEDWESLARVYAIYSHLLFDLGRKEESRKNLEKASKAAIKSGSMHKYHFNLIKWGQYLWRSGETKSGIDSLKKAIHYFERIEYKEAWHHASSMLGHAYAKDGRYDSAYAILYDMILFRRNMNVEQMSRQSKLYRVELDVYEKEKQIESQAREIEMQNYEKEIAEAKQKRWFIAGFSILIIILLLAFIYIQFNKQRTKTEKAGLIIKEREQAFRSVIEGQEEERKRIAQELHDGIGQQLSGIKMALQNITANVKEQEGEYQNTLKSIIKLVSISSTEVRQLAHQMLPQVLEEKGLNEALKDLIQNTYQSTGIKFNFDNQLEKIDLEKEWKLTIYRSIQELISNTIKHSGASEIDLFLYESNATLLVAYSDNGKGILEATSQKGLGLNGIKNRVENLKGNFTVDYSASQGFNAIFKIPLDRQDII